MAIPIITIGIPSKTKISSVSGNDQSIVTFQSDQALRAWLARATAAGAETGHGTGLLVESGTTLAAGVNASVIVDDEELTNGDMEYTITVFGQSNNGYWSDGTFEAVNILDLSTDILESYCATVSGDSVIFDTGSQNNEGGEIKVQAFLDNWNFVYQYLWAESTGMKSVNFTRTNDFDWLQIAANGDVLDSYIMIDANIMTVGETYTLTFTVDQISANHSAISGISLVRAVI